MRHFLLRGASGVAKKGNLIDLAFFFFLNKYEAFSAVRCVWCGKIRVWRLPGAPWSSLALSGASWRSLRSLALPGGPFGVPWRSLALPGSPSDVSWRSLALRGAPWRCLALPGASWRSLALSGVCCSLVFRSARRRSLVLLGAPWDSLALPSAPVIGRASGFLGTLEKNSLDGRCYDVCGVFLVIICYLFVGGLFFIGPSADAAASSSNKRSFKDLRHHADVGDSPPCGCIVIV